MVIIKIMINNFVVKLYHCFRISVAFMCKSHDMEINYKYPRNVSSRNIW